MSQEDVSESTSRDDDKRGSPAPGCLIVSMIILIFGGLIVLYTYVGVTQNREIDKFTEDQAAKIKLYQPEGEQVAAAKAKLKAVETAVSQNKTARILFTADDLNTLMATMEVAKDFRGQTYIKEIKESGILAEMAQPMRKGIFEKGFRYLNGTFLFSPELRARTIAFLVKDIQPKKGVVPEKFVSNWAAIDFFKLDPKNEVLAAHVGSLKRVYTEDGHLVVETKIVEEK